MADDVFTQIHAENKSSGDVFSQIHSESQKQPESEGFWHSFSAFLPGYHEDDPWGALKDFVSGAKEMSTHPIESGKLLYHGVTDPMEATAQAGLSRMKQPGVMNKISGATEYLEGGIPLVGPALSKAGHQIESKDYSGAAGTMTGIAIPVIAGSPEARSAILHPVKTTLSAAGKVLPEGLPARMYQSALKPSTTLSVAKAAGITKAGLENEIAVSAGGQEKLGNLLDEVRDKVQAQIDAGAGKGVTVNKFAVTSRLTDTYEQMSRQVNPEKAQTAVGRAGNEFLRNQPNEIPADVAQGIKQGTYQQIRKSYGQLSSAAVESQKALARGIKEELADQIPEISQLNAKESQLIGLDKALERAVRRISNHQLGGIGTPITVAGVGAITKSSKLAAAAGILKAVVDDPVVKSKLAIALARKGGGLTAAHSRIAGYSAALANAASASTRGDQSNEQESEP